MQIPMTIEANLVLKHNINTFPTPETLRLHSLVPTAEWRERETGGNRAKLVKFMNQNKAMMIVGQTLAEQGGPVNFTTNESI